MAKKEIWGYNFVAKGTDVDARLNLKPTKGLLSPTNKKSEYDASPKGLPSFFIPYDENGKPCWHKAKRIYTTRFASTEEEAREAYNRLVSQHVENMYEAADRFAQEFIKPVEPTIAVPPGVLTKIPDLRKDPNNE